MFIIFFCMLLWESLITKKIIEIKIILVPKQYISKNSSLLEKSTKTPEV